MAQRGWPITPPNPPKPGDRLFIGCDGGPCISRLVDYPPPLEIEDTGGLYVLNGDGTPDKWVYLWVPAETA